MKSTADFNRNRSKSDGLGSWCKPCANALAAAWYAADPGARRKQNLAREYGLTPEDYEGMLSAQSGLCRLCGEPETKRDNRTGLVYALAVDHDHETGAVRGLLCSICNVGLGYFRDDPELLVRAAEYIRSYR